MTTVTTLELSKIRIDGGTQSRVQMDMSVVMDYTTAMQEGASFPEITVFFDGSDYWLADGFHRIAAATAAGLEGLPTDIKNGSLEDAQWYSIGANKYHGLRRSNEDKAQAVITALKHPNGIRLSDRQIAAHVGVSHTTVQNYRAELQTTGKICQSEVRQGLDGRIYDIANIGQRISGYDSPIANHNTRLPSTFGQIDFDTPQMQEAERIFAPMMPDQWPPATLYSESRSLPLTAANMVDDPDGDEWYTPAQYIEAARELMGGIDLDPASCDTAQEIVKATEYYTQETNGLDKTWYGRVWLNPPYSTKLVQQFTARLIDQYESGAIDNAVLLVNNCTDTAWFHALMQRYPMCFTRGRVPFWRPNQENFATRQGQTFFYLGADHGRFTNIFSQFGVVVNKVG